MSSEAAQRIPHPQLARIGKELEAEATAQHDGNQRSKYLSALLKVSVDPVISAGADKLIFRM